MASGIYSITNTVNGRKYVGRTTDWHRRELTHRRDLRKGTHHNEHLQRAWVKYGEDAFEFKLEVHVPRRRLRKVEQQWLDANVGGYNIATDASAPSSRRGVSPTAETREKLRKASLGQVHTAEHNRKIGKSLLGRTYSAETRRRIAAAHRDKRYGKPARGYGKHTQKDKWFIKVRGKYYGLVATEAKAIKRVAEIREQLKQAS